MRIIKLMEDSSFARGIKWNCLEKVPVSCQLFPGGALVSLANPILDPHYSCIDLLGSLARIGFITL